MRRLFVCLLVGFCTSAHADLVGDVLGTLRNTSSGADWQYKYLGGPNTGTEWNIRPNEDFDWEARRTYNNGVLDTAGYNEAHTISSSLASSLYWNTDISWISSTNTGKDLNGYYSYVTTMEDTFSLDGNQSVAFNGLSISFASDDHLHAILINGVSIGYEPEGSMHPGWIQNHYDISLSDIDWFANGMNTIEFIVHNVNWDPAGQYFGGGINAAGLSATIQAAYLMKEGDAATPEPATMLIFGTGLLALPFVRRLRKK